MYKSASHVMLSRALYGVILSVLDPRKCEYLKDCSLDFEHPLLHEKHVDTRGDAGNVRHHCPGRAERDASCLRKWPARRPH